MSLLPRPLHPWLTDEKAKVVGIWDPRRPILTSSPADDRELQSRCQKPSADGPRLGSSSPVTDGDQVSAGKIMNRVQECPKRWGADDPFWLVMPCADLPRRA